MTIRLASFCPLVWHRKGQEAISKYRIPPFVDYSCRREPDLMSSFPSITALCRKGKFAPYLQAGDTVIYITVKGNYFGIEQKHWRLVAILEVIHHFASHLEAGAWYESQGLPLPTNCITHVNPPLSLDLAPPIKHYQTDLRKWDLAYQSRARQYGDFLICKPVFKELYEPPLITDDTMLKVFGKIPLTRNPPKISIEHYELLKAECGIAETVERTEDADQL